MSLTYAQFATDLANFLVVPVGDSAYLAARRPPAPIRMLRVLTRSPLL